MELPAKTDKQTPPEVVTTPSEIQPTGIRELDSMLHGGIPRGAAVLLAGSSGSGKTILTLQWLFAGYEQYQEPGLYISLTEPITKTLRNAKKLSFFKEENVGPQQIYFTDMRGIMEGMDVERKEISFKDIDQITSTLKLMVDQSKAKRVVIDSITAMAYVLKEKDKIRDFIFKLGTLLAQTDTSVILVSEVVGEGYSVFGTEEFIADGIIKLTPTKNHGVTTRQLDIVKMRGTDYEDTPATFRIGENGIRLFEHNARALEYPVSTERVPMGTDGLDQMSFGGLFKGSSTILSGPSGSGKTLLGMQFLRDGLKRGEKCLMISLEESADQLRRIAEGLGWDLQPQVESGQLEFICSYPEQSYLDEHLDRIMKTIAKNQAQRVVFDSVSALETANSKEAIADFNARLITNLKQVGVTSVFIHASDALLGAESAVHAYLSSLYDNIIMLRYVELQSQLKHLILILKMRGTKHDKNLRELIFTPKGVKIVSSFTGIEGALTGDAKIMGQTAEQVFYALLIGLLGTEGESIFESEKAKGLSLDRIEPMIQDFADKKVISDREKEVFLQKIKSSLS